MSSALAKAQAAVDRKASNEHPSALLGLGPAFVDVDLAALGAPIPPTRWVWGGRIPRGEVTLLAGHGGAGKSWLALMLALLAWRGEDAFGVPTTRCRVAFYSGEDRRETVLRRTKLICPRLGLPLPTPGAGFHLLDAYDAPELYVTHRVSGQNIAGPTKAYDDLRAFIEANEIGFIVIDNASDVFAGDEIRRVEVRGFIRSLAQLARNADGAVLLLAHVDKLTAKAAANANGQAYSGSTAWSNSVRSRLFISQPRPHHLEIEHLKSNHSLVDAEPVRLEWEPDDVPRLAPILPCPVLTKDKAADKSRIVVEPAHVRRILQAIDEFTQRGEFVSTAYNSRTAAPATIFRDELNKKFPTTAATREAQRAGYLVAVEYRGRGHGLASRWEISATGRQYAGLPGAGSGPAKTVS